MEQQIFYWTGCLIWWGLCLMAMCGTVSITIIAPIWVAKRFRKVWWRWYTLAKFVDLGWSQEELNHIAGEINGVDDYFLEKAKRAIEVAKDMRSEVDKALVSKVS